MGRKRSRSPKRKSRERDRSRERRHDRDRSRDRDGDEDRRRYSKHSGSSSSRGEASSSKEKDVQRGIDAARSRLKASLTTAITDLKVAATAGGSDTSSQRQQHELDFSGSVSMLDSVNRHRAIEHIESEGFRPAMYVSGAGARTGRKGEQAEEQALKDHDRAMFGPQWQSKELSKKVDARAAPKEPKQEPGGGGHATTDDGGASGGPRGVDYPLIHENLSADPEGRHKRWLALFKEQRRLLFEGALH